MPLIKDIAYTINILFLILEFVPFTGFSPQSYAFYDLLSDSFRAFASIALTVDIFLFLNNKLKEYIKPITVPSYNQKKLPLKIKIPNGTSDLLAAFSGESSHLLQDPLSDKNVILGSRYAKDFVRIPETIFNPWKGQAFTNGGASMYHRFERRRFDCIAFDKMFDSLFSDRLIAEESAVFEKLIKTYPADFGTHVGGGIVKIDDAMDFIFFILSENAYLRVFGENLLRMKKTKDILDRLIFNTYLNFPPTSILAKLKSLTDDLSFQINSNRLSKFVEIEAESIRSNPNRFTECTTAIEIATNAIDPNREIKYGDLTHALLKFFSALPSIPATRLLNVIIDISVRPEVILTLIREQKLVKIKCGSEISGATLDKMSYLDAVIKESLLLSIPASFMHRRVEMDSFLSNGYSLSKGSLLSLDMFSHYHTNNRDPTEDVFNPTKHLRLNKKLNDTTDNLIWGYGSHRCPVVDYASVQLKLVICVLIRNYYIFNNIDGNTPVHPGYKQLSTVIPKSSTIFLKRHNIDEYR